MCGIVGYVGARQAQEVVLDGLRRLEYRGYDSAGIAVVAQRRLAVSKKAGKLANLEKAIADHPLPASTTGSGTPAGRPTAPRTTSTRIRMSPS